MIKYAHLDNQVYSVLDTHVTHVSTIIITSVFTTIALIHVYFIIVIIFRWAIHNFRDSENLWGYWPFLRACTILSASAVF
jgi:hypothetical protein